jgi:hypothetical protein
MKRELLRSFTFYSNNRQRGAARINKYHLENKKKNHKDNKSGHLL